MPLDLEEQEQLAELKAWWNRYGSFITALVVALAVAVVGWQGWNWYQREQAVHAANLYETLVKAVQATGVLRDGASPRDRQREE